MSRKKRRRKKRSSVNPSVEGKVSNEQASSLSQSEETRMGPDPEPTIVPTDYFSEPTKVSTPHPDGFFSEGLQLPKERCPWWVTALLILFAYALSVYVRLDWIEFANGDKMESLRWEGVPMPNTHDSFYFGSVLQKGLDGRHGNNEMVDSVLHNGMITYLPYLLVKYTSLTIEEVLLWVPVWVSGLVCVPLVLIGRLYGSVFWGFFAACLAVVSTSYYNRTLAGYFDTDMYSVTVPVFALFFLLAACRKESLRYALAGALTLYLYRFFYSSGQTISSSLGVAFIGYRFGLVILHWIDAKMREEEWKWFNPSFVFSLKASLLVGFALYAEEWSRGVRIEQFPLRFVLGLVALVGGFFLLRRLGVTGWREIPKDSPNDPRKDLESSISPSSGILARLRSRECLAGFTVVFLFFVIFFGGIYGKIATKVESYVEATGSPKDDKTSSSNQDRKIYNLQFHNLLSTVQEAQDIDKENVRNRILADAPECNCPGCKSKRINEAKAAAREKGVTYVQEDDGFSIRTATFAFIGFILLVLRFWEFSIGLPFAVVAFLCYSGAIGLRFTVHSIPVASLGIAFLVLVICWAGARLICWAGARLIGKRQPWLPLWGRSGAILLGFLAICFLVRPNIQHAARYDASVVYPKGTVEGLKVLQEKSSEDDVVITWWDYGSGIWFYSGNRTLAAPSKQTVDAYLLSQVLRTSSQEQAANLCRVITEEFVSLKEKNKKAGTRYTTAVRSLFKDGSADLEYYPKLLADLASGQASLPPKTRDVFVYLHYNTLRIFQTSLQFSERNLFVGPQSRDVKFESINKKGRQFPTPVARQFKGAQVVNGSIKFEDNSTLDSSGILKVSTDDGKFVSWPISRYRVIGEEVGSSSLVSSHEYLGLKLSAAREPSSLFLVLLPKQKHAILLDKVLYGSTMAKKYLFESFDPEVYNHPSFGDLLSGKTGSIYGGVRVPTWSERLAGKRLHGIGFHPIDGSRAGTLTLRNYGALAVNQNKLEVTPMGAKISEPYAFIRLNTDPETKELIHEVLFVQQKIKRLSSLDHFTKLLEEGKLKIPYFLIEQRVPHFDLEKGYQIGRRSYFMDREFFDSFLCRAFLREDLDPKLFETVHSSPWGKIYKVVNR